MSEDTRFVTSNKNKTIFEFRSEINNQLAPNVILISSDNVKVKGHSIILGSCHYFKELFKKDKTENSHLIFHESLSGDVLEFVVKYIYTGEYSLLSVDKLPEVIRATSKENFNIPALAKGYLLKQLDTPEGLTHANWHIFYKNGIKLSLGDEYCNQIYAFLKEKHPEFYKSEEFKSLTFDQICKIMSSPNLPFQSNTTLMEATLIWTREHNEAGMDKLAELSKICINLFQNGNPNPQSANSPTLDASQSADISLSTSTSPELSILSDPHCSTTKKRKRSISPQINTLNRNGKRSKKEPNLNGIARNSPKPSNLSHPTLPSSYQSVNDLINLSRSDTHPQSVHNPTPSTITPPRMKTRANSQKNGTQNLNIKKSVVEIYQPPKYSWESAQLLFFSEVKPSESGHLWSYSFQSGEVKKMAKIPKINFDKIMCLLASQDRIYLTGESLGYPKHDLFKSFPIRDLENMDKAWERGPKLTSITDSRLGASILRFRNTIYLFAESQNNSCIKKLDIGGKIGVWKDVKNMMCHRDYFGVALLDNVIYMIGGIGAKKYRAHSSKTLDTAESYNIDDGTQSLLPNMNQARSHFQVVALKDRIYAIGGLNYDDEELTSVESYKPGDPSWTQVAHMNHPRFEGSAFVLDDMIYVAGGHKGDHTMETYCPHQDTWTMVDANLPKWAELYSSVLLGPSNF